MSQSLKYAVNLQNILEGSDIPCTSNCSEVTRVGFRWVFENIQDQRNFKPVAEQGRFTNICSGWAISLYDSIENSEKKYYSLTKDKPKVYKKLGTHIAEGTIRPEDGICSPLNTAGHFDCHEYVNTNFSDTFTVIKPLVTND